MRHSDDRLDAVDDDEVEQPVEVEIDDGAAPAPLEADDPRLLGTLDERAVGLAEQQVVGVTHRVVLLGLDVALGDEQVEEPVVVDVGELGVPGRGRQHVAAGERAMGGGPDVRRAMSSYVGWAGPSASVCSLLSP